MNRQKNILNKYIKSIMFLLFFTISVIGCGSISDGEYAASVTLTGGSGRASIESPCTVTAKNGKLTARIVWSSPNYDYMIVDGKRYDKVNTEGNSEFEIPVVLDNNPCFTVETDEVLQRYVTITVTPVQGRHMTVITESQLGMTYRHINTGWQNRKTVAYYENIE